MERREKRTESSHEHAKKPYQPPKLEILGTVAELTKSIGLGGHDGITGSRLLPAERRRQLPPPKQ
jgi:hypothetical protein